MLNAVRNRRLMNAATSLMMAVVVLGSPAVARGQDKSTTRPTNVLFICPHGAAKSVLASAYFTQLALERGLRVKVDAVGTEPDAAVAASVASHLSRQGLAVPIKAPRRVTASDLKTADIVISLGCDIRDLPASHAALRQWDDIPGPGEHFAEADAAIRARVVALIDELVRRKP